MSKNMSILKLSFLKNYKKYLFLQIGRSFFSLFSFQVRLRSKSLHELSVNQIYPLHIPTYEGTSQAVHPDIVPPDTQHPFYVLAFTPYPFSYDEFENPSILISTDGIRFSEETEGINPLVPPPAIDHNDDPDLTYLNGRWYLVYLETLRPYRQNLVLLSSIDRIHWESSILISYQFTQEPKDPLIVSPSLLWDQSTWYLFYVNRSVTPYRIEYSTSKDIRSWDPKNVSIPTIEGMSFTPWHLDIFKGQDVYFMLITSVSHIPRKGRVYDLHIARSSDLIHWTCSPHRVIPQKPPFWKGIYRSTGFCRADDLFVYFSYETILGIWRIGLVRKKIKDLFPEEGDHQVCK
ncbi:MAG: hypothetical protein N2442_09300 [Spirochaetes bacterium]|nr:hypothetical protein [Spirochaetota bacterium]